MSNLASGEHQGLGDMAEIEQELAQLRHLWGGAYRIGWDGRFYATHIESGERFAASSPAKLRMLLLAHHNELGVSDP